MAVRKMFLLPCGYIEIDQSTMTAGIGVGEIVRAPAYSTLLSTDDGWVLVDTGLNPDGLDNPGTAWGPRASVVRPTITRDDDIRERLRELGVSINDVKVVINTHLHWDHTGGNRFFRESVFIVQKAEYRFALYPDRHLSAPYMENHFKHPLNYQLVEGAMEVVPGVSVVPTPGHTAGHQTVIVNLPEGGPVILCGDAVYCYASLQGPVPPGHCWSQPFAMNSIHQLICLRDRLGAKLIPGHEPNLWKEFVPSPMSYR